ncbi:MAG: hypothetical protein R3229_03890 [Alphaproteobacteria bacterium]|nr:hypothetical protein [Alphaproteobacteria bacterium]
MKLNSAQLASVQEQLGIEAIPEEHPLMPRLQKAFGDHSFLVDAKGLNIITEDAESSGSDGNLVKLASWSDDRTQLNIHEPEDRNVRVDLSSSGMGSMN